MNPCPRCDVGELKPLSTGTCAHCSNYGPVLVCKCGLVIDERCLAAVRVQKKEQAKRDLSKEFRPEGEEGSSV